MSQRFPFASLLAVAAVLLSGTGLAQAKEPAEGKVEKVRLYVDGAYCMGCSSVLTQALASGGVAGASKISPNAGRGYVIVLGKFDHDDNLSAVAKVVNAADTPHRTQAPPGVALEVFAKLDEASAKKSKEVLAKLPGVDSENSQSDVKRGVISVRLTGEDKVSVKQILAALAQADIEAKVVTGGAKRYIGGEKKEDAATDKE